MKRETLTVEEAGRLLGIGRGSAYEAARRGDIPVIRIGKRLLVPRAAMARLLDCPREGAFSDARREGGTVAMPADRRSQATAPDGQQG